MEGKKVTKKTYKVIKEFTLDKVYKVGSSIELGKVLAEKLISNKIVK